MTTTITTTGTGTPIVRPGLAGPGVLVQYTGDDGTDIALQFDAGRNTAGRLIEAGVTVGDLDAVFVTHYHSDHVVGLQDIVLTRWVQDFVEKSEVLDLVAGKGESLSFLERMLDPWDNDLHVRDVHAPRQDPVPRTRNIGFAIPDAPTEVWAKGDVRVLAGQVRHEPVINAVGYRVETPDGVVVITGDTLVCDEVAELSTGADVVVYEAMRYDVVFNHFPESMHYIAGYHADAKAIGSQMAQLEIPTVMLTHLIPHVESEAHKQGYVDDLRGAGYQGRIVVCQDLDSVTI